MWRGNLEFGEVGISVEVSEAETAKLIQRAFSELEFVEEDRVHDIVIRISNYQDAPTKWQIEDHARDTSRVLTSEGNLIYHLSDCIVFHVADKTKSGHCLHAAAVAVDNNACVIPASSGSGKSSFVAWLVANGFPYLTDELVVIGEGGQMRAVARPIQIKAHGIKIVEPMLKEGARIHRGGIANAVSAKSLGGVNSKRQDHKITTFVFPKYNAESSYELRRLSDAEAGMSLMGNHVNARNLEGHGFQAMMKLIKTTHCYRLEYGGFDLLPGDFAEQFSQIIRTTREVKEDVIS